MRNISDKSCSKNGNTLFVFNKFSCGSLACYDNVEVYSSARQATDDNMIRRMRFACWIADARNTHSEYLMLIAFPRQQWFRERFPMLRS
jgi:hypothetical protein